MPMASLGERLTKAWNAFRNKDPTEITPTIYYGPVSSYPLDMSRKRRFSDRTIISPILNRIAVDASTIELKHVRLDTENDRYKEDIKDSLNDVLTLEANIDQTARAFRQDIYASLMDEGFVAICPIDADVNEKTWTVDELKSARVGKIVGWHPRHVDVDVYDENTGEVRTITQPKSLCSIVQNPFWDIMNAPNSLLHRLRRKMAMLDAIDEQTASGKLDLIIQLPYATRADTQKSRAEERKKDIEMQLGNSKYGIAYMDSSEKIIQLNRSIDNTLQPQIESLTKQLMDQLGMSPEILNGTASDQTQQNYVNNILEPLVSAVVDEMKRKWISKNARTRGESIMFFKDPFRLMPVSKIADMADKFTRNEIMSSNEFRVKCGLKPSDQADADELRNKNINQSTAAITGGQMTPEVAADSSSPEGGAESAGAVTITENEDGTIPEEQLKMLESMLENPGPE